MSLSNQKCEIQPTLNYLHPNNYSRWLHYYPFAVKLDKCVGSCNTLNVLSNKLCVQSKTEDSNIHVFNMITGKSESKFLTKDISRNVNLDLIEENVIEIKSGIMINVDVSVKSIIYVKKIIFGILLHVVVKMETV